MSQQPKVPIVIFGLVAVLACSASVDGEIPETYVAKAQFALPASSLADIVSYAVQVSEISVTAQREIPPPFGVLERQEGYVGREVTIRVDNTIWNSPSESAAPGEFNMIVAGWILKGDKKIPLAIDDSPRLEVGGRYVVPLTKMTRAIDPQIERGRKSRNRNSDAMAVVEYRWGPVTTATVFAVGVDAIANADVRDHGNSALAKEVSTLPRSEFQKRLSLAVPDPLAVRFGHLPAVARYRSVLQARQAAAR